MWFWIASLYFLIGLLLEAIFMYGEKPDGRYERRYPGRKLAFCRLALIFLWPIVILFCFLPQRKI